MQKNDIALYKGEEVRVLSIEDDNAYVISLSGRSAPKPIKTVSTPKYVPTKKTREPINMVQMLNDKSIDMLSILKSNYEVVEI